MPGHVLNCARFDSGLHHPVAELALNCVGFDLGLYHPVAGHALNCVGFDSGLHHAGDKATELWVDCSLYVLDFAKKMLFWLDLFLV